MIWKVIIVLIGIIILGADFSALVYKKFTELMGVGWAVFAIIIILIGVVPGLSDWTMLMGSTEYLAAFLIFITMVLNSFLICMRVSLLIMKNQELAMQVSLLNQENERILYELELLTGKSKTKL